MLDYFKARVGYREQTWWIGLGGDSEQRKRLKVDICKFDIIDICITKNAPGLSRNI